MHTFAMNTTTIETPHAARQHDISLQVSVVFHAPSGARCNPRRLASLLEELSHHEHAGSCEVLLDGIDPGDDGFREITQQHDLATHADASSATGEAEGLNAAVQSARGEIVVLVDGRAFLRPGALSALIDAVHQDAQLACVAPTEHDADLNDTDLDRWVRLFRRLPDAPAMAWRQDLFERMGGFDPSLSHHYRADFLLRAAESAPMLLLDRSLGTLPSVKDEIPLLQARLDEGHGVANTAMDRFLSKNSAPFFLQDRIAPVFFKRTQRVLDMLRMLQAGERPDPEALLQATAVYALLAIRLDELPNAREIVDAVCEILPEQRDLVRIYKKLLLSFTIENAPSQDDIARVEGVPEGPKVVVATPLFNQGRYLEEAIRSVLNQTYRNWEMVIVDDDSTDDSFEQARAMLAKFDDPRLTLLHQENSGLGATRNKAIKASDGEYVVCLDADDMIAPDYFAIALDMLHTHRNAGWVNVKTLVFGGSNHLAWKDDFDFTQCLIASASACTSMLRREALAEVGYFREDLTAREDWEVWLSLLDHGWSYVTTEAPLFFYRHALKRPGMMPLSNVPSKEEVISLHPWWFRTDLDETIRLKAYLEYTTVRFSPWFLNRANIERVLPVLGDREAFLQVMAQIRSGYPAIAKPKRWQNAPDDSYIATRKKKYGIL